MSDASGSMLTGVRVSAATARSERGQLHRRFVFSGPSTICFLPRLEMSTWHPAHAARVKRGGTDELLVRSSLPYDHRNRTARVGVNQVRNVPSDVHQIRLPKCFVATVSITFLFGFGAV